MIACKHIQIVDSDDVWEMQPATMKGSDRRERQQTVGRAILHKEHVGQCEMLKLDQVLQRRKVLVVDCNTNVTESEG